LFRNSKLGIRISSEASIMAVKLTKKKQAPKKIVKKTKSEVKAREVKNQMSRPGKYVEAVGRRKVATARVRIYEGKGDFLVNGKAAGEYFANINNAATKYMQPFNLTETKGKFGVTAKVSGSGISAQLGAVIHGLTRALVAFEPEFRSLLKVEGLLTRDDRMKETRKPGRGGKARRKRQSPKR